MRSSFPYSSIGRRVAALWRGGIPGVLSLIFLGLSLRGFAGADAGGAVGKNLRILWPGPPKVRWVRREYESSGRVRSIPVAESESNAAGPPGIGGKASPGRSAEFRIRFPGDNEFVLPSGRSWSGWAWLGLELLVPRDLPRDTQCYVFTKDWDFLWRQVRVRLPPPGSRRFVVRAPLCGPAARRLWRPVGHERPWNPLTPGQVTEFGVKFVVPAGRSVRYSGVCLLRKAWLERAVSGKQAPVGIRRLEFQPRRPRVGQVCEITAALSNAEYTDPFDPRQVRIEAVLQAPSGESRTVPGFYYEGFVFKESRRPMALEPWGAPVFKIRFTPEAAGIWRVRVRAALHGRGSVQAPEFTIPVAPARRAWHGFVRVDSRDRRFFAFTDGTVFNGAGINVRSPYDARYIKNVPYSLWQDRDLAVYPYLFRKYRRAGINVVEVWMCSWWLALEWIPDRPGYHGVGYMNQWNAWKLDRIFQWARENGIYIILVFNNHGKFGMTFDKEWERNPYNVKNGGFLDDCEKFFSDPRAERAFRKFARYTVSRWAAYPNLLAWKLFTEVDLTGDSLEFYKNPVVAAWHRKQGAWLKQIDPYKHMITTHWMLSYHRINLAIADLPELDFLTTDAYYQKGGTPALLELLEGSWKFQEERHKPLLITEYGGSPYTASMGDWIKQDHLGLWVGWFRGFPVSPMFWWFALVDEKNLYPNYAAFHRFTAGEDRRGMSMGAGRADHDGVQWYWLKTPGRVFLWAFDRSYYLSESENQTARTVSGTRLPLADLTPGGWDVEFWDCHSGRIVSRCTVTVSQPARGRSGGALSLALPAFRRDIAVKLIHRAGP